MKQQATQIASNIVHVTPMQSAHTYESWLTMQVATNTLHKKTLTLNMEQKIIRRTRYKKIEMKKTSAQNNFKALEFRSFLSIVAQFITACQARTMFQHSQEL